MFESELRELKGNYRMGAEGMVLESRNITEKVAEEGLDQGKSCTLLIQRGILRVNDWVVIGD
jgi:translation initiation factor IF-2